MTKKTWAGLTILAVCLLLVYFLTSAGETPYDYFKRLGLAILSGRYWLTSHPAWLNELISSGDRYYVAYPPMPAILQIPFLVVLGSRLQQQWITHLLGVGIALTAFFLTLKVTGNKLASFWMLVLAGLGSINWYAAANGSVWLMGQITAEFFLLLAILETVTRRRLFLVSCFLGMGYFSRLQVILSLPFFVFMFRERFVEIGPAGKRVAKLYIGPLFAFFGPLAAFFLVNSLYNFARFGTIVDVGYIRIPGVLQEPWFSHGLFNLSYIPSHLKVIFGEMPKVLSGFPFFEPSWAGQAIWLTTPAFIYTLAAKIKDKEVLLAWMGALAIAVLDFSHGSTGFAQFGYRFAIDFYPFLFLIMAKSLAGGLTRRHWVLLLVSILVNGWGVMMIDKLGMVGY